MDGGATHVYLSQIQLIPINTSGRIKQIIFLYVRHISRFLFR